MRSFHAPAPSRLRRYHADIGIPPGIEYPTSGTTLTYTVHAYQAVAKSNIAHMLPKALPPHTLVEVTALGRTPVQWVVRCRIDSARDVVLVVTNEYLVKTVWVNQHNDLHATLDRTKYDRPGEEEHRHHQHQQ